MLSEWLSSEQPWLCLVEGEPGIGKTSLWDAVCSSNPASTCELLSGQADDLDQSRPFAALLDALERADLNAAERARLQHLRELLGRGEAAADVQNVGFVALDTFVDLIETRAVQHPVVLALDDAQWVDPGTLGVLRDLRRRLIDLPFRLILLARPSPRSPQLDRFLESAGEDTIRVHLGPLADDDVTALAGHVLRGTPGESLRHELTRTSGNPLYLLELLGALEAESQLERRGSEVELVATSFPVGLRHAVLRRLRDLAPGSVDLVRSASVLGSAFTVNDLATVADQTIVALEPDLRELFKSGILVERGEQLAFAHDIVREAIYSDVPRPVRLALHLEIATSLERAGAPAVRIAPHLLLGATTGGADALRAIDRTAAALSRVAPDLSLRLLELGLELVETGSADWDAFANSSIRNLILLGRLTDAESRIRAVLARPHDPALDPQLRRGLHVCLERAGRLVERRAELERMVDDPRVGDRERADLQGSLAFTRLMTGDAAGARALGDAALLGGRRSGSLIAEIGADLTLSWICLAEGRPGSGVAHAERAAAAEARLSSTDPSETLPIDLQLGVALLDADRIDEGIATFRAGIRRSAQRGDPSGATILQWALTTACYFLCDFEGAIVEADAGCRAVEDGTGSELGMLLAYGVAGQSLLQLGRIEEAAARLADGEALLARNGPTFGADWLLWGLAGLAEARNDPGTALRLLSTSWDLTAGVRYFLLWRHLAPDLVRLALSEGDNRRATTVTAEVEEGARLAHDGAPPSAEVAALHCRGLVEGDPDMLLRAAELAGRGPRTVLAIRARVDAAAALVAAGRPAEAAPLTRADAPRPPRPEKGWGALTPAELRVVEVVAEGLTNSAVASRLFLSRYTVETHLKRVYSKLEISSRVELARAAGRRR